MWKVFWTLLLASALHGAWSDLQPGQTVRIDRHKGGDVHGVVRSVSHTSMRVDSTEISRGDIRRVYVEAGSRRLRNTIIGTVIGVAAGVALYSTFGQIYRHEGASSGHMLAVPISAGAAVGAVLPAKRMKLVYKQ